MAKKWRKPRPEPAPIFFFTNDNCWWCKHPSGCSGCNILKKQVAEEKEKRKRIDNARFKKEVKDYF